MTSIVRNSLKEKLQSGDLATCMSVRLVPSNDIVMIAQTAGFDSLYVDMEHCSFSLETVSGITTAGLLAGFPCLVRVGQIDQIQQVLDGGALGVIIPNVKTADDARAAVSRAKYPPIGTRGTSGSLPHLRYGTVPHKDAFAMVNDATAVVIQIESREGLENVEAIAAVKGIDILFVGTSDLLADLGLAGQFEHPAVTQAYQRIADACHANGIHLGIGGLAKNPHLIGALIKMGGRFISAGGDINFLLSGGRERTAEFADLSRYL